MPKYNLELQPAELLTLNLELLLTGTNSSYVRNSEVPIPTVIKDLELCIQSLKVREIPEEQQSEQRNNIRAEAINIIRNFYLKPRSNNRSQRDQDAIATKKFLKENRDLIIARSDEGNATVLMHREEYLQVMKRMLADESTYQRIEKDPTFKLERTANELVDRLQREGVISEETAKALKSHNSTTPRMYALRKIHKPGCNLRPVVSCIKAPTYKVARFLHELLVPVSSNSRFSVNSAEFTTFAGGVQLPQGYILASLDVVSLFTNIPKDLVVKIVEDKWEEWSTRVRASKELVVALVKFCFEGSYFTFDNELYAQMDGSSMGNPASPVLGGIVMDYVISEVLDKLPCNIPWLKLYVDDTVLPVPEDSIDMVLQCFNPIHDRIQFTVEREVERSISFLDVKIHRMNDGSLKLNWYQKPTSSGRVINYESNHLTAHKVGVVFGMLHRAIGLNHEDFHEANIDRVKDT
ncbi:uncharacterized protein LOC107046642 [Diachasma alloeum]|uniref:uncharacterized protein LOC107046642 n=1 Tax=Diachasma alloeum TaxID=454923 RepID=UPI0007382646|nr:uncharacterized protein LOC107046642 [Diachasma alloeum]